MSDGSQIEGMIYIMKMIRQSPPHSAYYKGIEDAYRKLGLRSQINTMVFTEDGRRYTNAN